MSAEENKVIAHRYLEAFFTKNLAALDDYVARDYVRHDPGLPFQVHGPEGVKQLVSALHVAFADFRNTIEDVIAEGDKVLIRMTTRGRHQGAFMGIPPTGKEITIVVIDLFRIVGGKVVEQWVARDDLGMLQQLGVIPIPEAAGT